jgi:hypothetical protein
MLTLIIFFLVNGLQSAIFGKDVIKGTLLSFRAFLKLTAIEVRTQVKPPFSGEKKNEEQAE